MTLLLTLSLPITACEKLDLSGMIESDESVNQRYEQSEEWNARHPHREIVVPSDDYFILSLADCHVGGTKNLDMVLNTAITTKASAVVMAGDLTTGHSSDYSVFQKHLPGQDSLPTFQMAGNHDLFFDGWNQFYSNFGSSTYYFTVKTPEASDLFICMDTGGGTVGDKQMDWLTNVLQTLRPAFRHCILFTHNNIFRYKHVLATNPPVEETNALIDLFTTYQVEMVVTGHEHEPYEESFGNTTYITIGALVDDFSDPGYFLINLKNGNLDHTFVRL